MPKILKVLGPDDEERDEWKAPENDLLKNGLEMDPEEETRRFIEKENTKRERFKKSRFCFC